MSIRLGIDTGGTFTDLVGVDETTGVYHFAKRPSTPSEPAEAVAHALEDIDGGAREIASLVLGTTVATNAMLQRRGARVLFVTTKGFEDVPFIGRLDKEELYNLNWKKPSPLVERPDCFGVAERIEYDGEIVVPLVASELERVIAFVQSRRIGGSEVAVAVCLLYSYIDPTHEKLIKRRLLAAFPDLAVSVSHEVSPTWREYERGSTVIGDAYIKPVIADYVLGVERALSRVGVAAPASMLKSNGGHLRLKSADTQPVQFLLSGLAGGIVAARHYAREAGAVNAFSLDMGGTSADIGTIQGGRERYLSEFQLGIGIPITVPCVDVATLGAGGGSIAWIDKGGLLQVGPRSAGAEPGPMCYGAGGSEPTVTDANLALGRLSPEYFLGGRVALDAHAPLPALQAIGLGLGAAIEDAVETAALAIIDTANENMANQIKLISVDRGLDPREFALIAFGGAGPVHATACARLLGIERVLVPPHPGLSSAFGALAAHWRVDRARTILMRSTQLDVEAIAVRLEEMCREALAELQDDGFTGEPVLLRSVDMRYVGQNYERELSLPDGPFSADAAATMIERFSRAHDEFYGFSLEGESVEFVNLRVSAIGPSSLVSSPGLPDKTEEPRPNHRRSVAFPEVGRVETPVYRREQLPAGFALSGPVIVEEPDSTTVIAPGEALSVLPSGLLEIRIRA